jgi:hypothetical protein
MRSFDSDEALNEEVDQLDHQGWTKASILAAVSMNRRCPHLGTGRKVSRDPSPRYQHLKEE